MPRGNVYAKGVGAMTSYAKKIEECVEIIDKGVFDDWQRSFLKNMRTKVRMSGERVLSLPEKKKIDECYDVACRSPY